MNALSKLAAVVLVFLMPFVHGCAQQDGHETDGLVDRNSSVSAIDCAERWRPFLGKLADHEMGGTGSGGSARICESLIRSREVCASAVDTEDLCDAYADKQKACAIEIVDHRSFVRALDWQRQLGQIYLDDRAHHGRFLERSLRGIRQSDLAAIEAGEEKCESSLAPLGDSLLSQALAVDHDLGCFLVALYTGKRRVRDFWSACFKTSSCTEYITCARRAKDMQLELWGKW